MIRATTALVLKTGDPTDGGTVLARVVLTALHE